MIGKKSSSMNVSQVITIQGDYHCRRLHMAWGPVSRTNEKLTIAKTLTKTTNCACRAKRVEGHEKFFSALHMCASPHFKICSSTTATIES